MLKLLLVKTSSLGDVVHNLPIVNDILHHYPNAQIDWLVEESFADIPNLHPAIKDVSKVAVRRWRKQLLSCNTWREIRTLQKHLSHRDYDIVLDTQGLIKSALFAMMAQGTRHGYDQHSIREPMASHTYQQVHHIPYGQHAVVRNRTLAAMALGYPIPTTPPDYGIAAHSPWPSNIDPMTNHHFVIGLHGTSRDSKLWPTDHWVALGHRLAEAGLRLLLPWASTAEHERAQQICNQINHAVVLPKLGINALATVISKARVAIGVDTGLSHLAAALNIPTIAIYTDTDPARTGVMPGAVTPAVNLGNKHIIPSVDDVMATLEKWKLISAS